LKAKEALEAGRVADEKLLAQDAKRQEMTRLQKEEAEGLKKQQEQAWLRRVLSFFFSFLLGFFLATCNCLRPSAPDVLRKRFGFFDLSSLILYPPHSNILFYL
jgi:hypothetical protein